MKVMFKLCTSECPDDECEEEFKKMFESYEHGTYKEINNLEEFWNVLKELDDRLDESDDILGDGEWADYTMRTADFGFVIVIEYNTVL